VGFVPRPRGPHTDEVTAVQVSRDGTRVVSASEDGTLRVWQVPLDATSADDIAPPRVLRARSAVLSLATSADASPAFLGRDWDGQRGCKFINPKIWIWSSASRWRHWRMPRSTIGRFCFVGRWLTMAARERTGHFSWATTTARSPSGQLRRGHVPRCA
jgi:WD domain, G-beta repeat